MLRNFWNRHDWWYWVGLVLVILVGIASVGYSEWQRWNEPSPSANLIITEGPSLLPPPAIKLSRQYLGGMCFEQTPPYARSLRLAGKGEAIDLGEVGYYPNSSGDLLVIHPGGGIARMDNPGVITAQTEKGEPTHFKVEFSTPANCR